MAEPLKNSFGPEVPAVIGDMIAAVYPAFDQDRFVAYCLEGFEELELTPRARHIADALAEFLPSDRRDALGILMQSMGPELETAELNGMDAFRYLPHVFFISEHGLDHFEEGMIAQYEVTKRFSAEFSIRAYLDRYTKRTLARLREWTADPNVHVRRLVSEGSRPRLPWAPRLRQFQQDPVPVVELLEMLKDDPEEYVRRSVANNLNDISKDHPDLVAEIGARWWEDGSNDRRRLVRHGLRTLIKQAHPGALAVLGFSSGSPVRVGGVRISPDTVSIGATVRIEVDIENPAESASGGLVDLIVHFVKANGSTSPKVFKGAERMLGPGEQFTLAKTISVRQHTTRTHYPGEHRIEVQLNGAVNPGGSFVVRE